MRSIGPHADRKERCLGSGMVLVIEREACMCIISVASRAARGGEGGGEREREARNGPACMPGYAQSGIGVRSGGLDTGRKYARREHGRATFAGPRPRGHSGYCIFRKGGSAWAAYSAGSRAAHQDLESGFVYVCILVLRFFLCLVAADSGPVMMGLVHLF